MVAEWFYEADGKQFGPVTAADLKRLAVNGFLQPTHLIWKEGLQKKVPARSVKGLFTEPAPIPASAAAAAPAAPAAPARQTATAPSTPAPAPAKKPKPAEEQLETLEPVEQLETLEPADQLETLEPVEEELETLEPAEQLETLEPAEDEAELEAVEGAPRKKERLPREPDPADVIAEIPATYRGGHPKLEEPLEGTLYLEKSGLWFTPTEGRPIRIAYADIDNVIEPAKGDFPDSLKSSARNAKLAGGAAKLVGNIAGNWLGGWGGKALQGAGKTAGDATAKMDLGKPPKNRLVIVARVGEKRHKILFDTIGQSRPEMEDDAKSFYKQIVKARSNPGAAAEAPAAGGAARMALAGGGAGWSSAPAVPGKPFRVLRNGQPQGPFSLEEVRRMLRAGQLGALDLIGVEMWLPIAGVGGLLVGMGGGGGGGGAAAARGAATGGAAGGGETISDEEAAAAEEPEEIEDEPEEPEEAPAPASDDAPLPVDEDL